jgi:inhibitor of cysteine peptidase
MDLKVCQGGIFANCRAKIGDGQPIEQQFNQIGSPGEGLTGARLHAIIFRLRGNFSMSFAVLYVESSQGQKQGGAKVLRKIQLAGGIAVLLVVLALVGCGATGGIDRGADVVRADVKEVQVGAQDNGKRIEVEKGQTLVVTLESNPTTGYSWEVIEGEGTVLQQKGEVEFQPSNAGDQQLVGAGGTETFRFEAAGTGEVTLKLIYHRSWEKGVEPLQTFSMQVTVR